MGSAIYDLKDNCIQTYFSLYFHLHHQIVFTAAPIDSVISYLKMNIAESSETELKTIKMTNMFDLESTSRGTKRSFMDANNNLETKITDTRKTNKDQVASTENAMPQPRVEKTCRDIKQRTPEGGWKWVHWVKEKVKSFLGRWGNNKDIIVTDEREYLMKSNKDKSQSESNANGSNDSLNPSYRKYQNENTPVSNEEN